MPRRTGALTLPGRPDLSCPPTTPAHALPSRPLDRPLRARGPGRDGGGLARARRRAPGPRRPLALTDPAFRRRLAQAWATASRQHALLAGADHALLVEELCAEEPGYELVVLTDHGEDCMLEEPAVLPAFGLLMHHHPVRGWLVADLR